MKIDLTHKTFRLENLDADQLKDFLIGIEQDISMSMNDYRRLRALFVAVVGREPREINAINPLDKP